MSVAFEVGQLAGFMTGAAGPIIGFTLLGTAPFMFFKKTRQWKTGVYVLLVVAGWQYAKLMAGLTHDHGVNTLEMAYQDAKILALGVKLLYVLIFAATPFLIFELLPSKSKWKHLFWMIPVLALYVGLHVELSLSNVASQAAVSAERITPPEFSHAAVSSEQITPPEFKRDIMRLLELTGSDRLGLQMATASSSRFIDALRKENPKVPQALVDSAKDETEKFLTQKFPDLVAMLVPIYAAHFSHDDIIGLIAFYETPLGARSVAVLPRVVEESMHVGEQWAERLAPELVARITSRLRSEGFLGKQ